MEDWQITNLRDQRIERVSSRALLDETVPHLCQLYCGRGNLLFDSDGWG